MGGIASTLLYTALGIALFLLGYFGVFLLLRGKVNLNRELDEHNVAAGIALSGLFIGIAIVVSGVIQ